MAELHEHKVKRLHMRSMRRGIKEMDLILPSYAATRLATMDDAALSLYDDMLSENDRGHPDSSGCKPALGAVSPADVGPRAPTSVRFNDIFYFYLQLPPQSQCRS